MQPGQASKLCCNLHDMSSLHRLATDSGMRPAKHRGLQNAQEQRQASTCLPMGQRYKNPDHQSIAQGQGGGAQKLRTLWWILRLEQEQAKGLMKSAVKHCKR